MPPRIQNTPHGDVVTLTSRWMRDRYHLSASGPFDALRWMFQYAAGSFEAISPTAHRHVFSPSPGRITDMRELIRTCAQWQATWNIRLDDWRAGVRAAPSEQVSISTGRLGDTVSAYLRLRAGELAASSLERNRHYLERWVKALGAQLPLTELTEERLVAARTAIAKELQPSTVNCLVAALKTLLRWADEREIPVHKAYLRFTELSQID